LTARRQTVVDAGKCPVKVIDKMQDIERTYYIERAIINRLGRI